MKDKSKKKVSILFLLIIMLILIVALIGISNKINSPNEDSQNNIEKNVSHEDQGNQTIQVIIDKNKNEEENTEPQNNENNENSEEGNVNNKGEENSNTTANENNKKDKTPYYIKVNNKANTVTIYKKDSNGKYTVPVKAMICSIGDATPASGVYKTSDMYKWRLLQGDVYGQYAVRITGHILFHSVPYQKQAKDTLEWWEYDKLGTDASLGCIRLTVEDAKWIYDNCPKGTQVEFYSDSNPGPLGKPTAKKISSYDEELKKWDPTDPDTKNPWRTYVDT